MCALWELRKRSPPRRRIVYTRQQYRCGGRIDELLVIARSSRAESIVTTLIIGAGWRDCMSRNSPLSITARVDRGVTRYERDGGRRLHKYWWRSWTICCWIFKFGVGAFRSRKTSEWKGPRRGRMVEDSSGMEGSSGRRMIGKVGCGRGSGIDSGSYGFLGGSSW